MPVLQTGSGQIETVNYGSGDAAMVLVHAAGAGPHSFDRLAKQLDTGKQQFVAPALIGYGDTKVKTHGDRVDQNAAVVEALLAEIAPREIVLFGHSMGGLISLVAAANTASQTEARISSIVLFDPILVTLLRTSVAEEKEALNWDRGIIARFNEHVAEGRLEDGVQTFIESWNGQNWSDIPQPVRSHFVAQAETLLAETMATSYHPLHEEALRQINVPVLILVGENSPAMIRLTATRAAELLPSAKVELIAGADHMAPVNNPKLIVPVIEQFRGG